MQVHFPQARFASGDRSAATHSASFIPPNVVCKKPNYMIKNLIIIVIGILTTFQSKGQLVDSSKVEKIYYDNDSRNKKGIWLTGLQLKAKPNYDLGYSLNGNHEFAKAIEPLKRAIEIDTTGNCGTGKNGTAYGELAYSYTRLDDYNNAIINLNKAILLNGKIPEPYLNKAVLLLQHGQDEQAINTLDLLIENIPNYALAYVQRGFIYESIKKPEQALNNFKMFLNLVKEQKQEKNSKALVDKIKARIKEIERETKN
jgi:tetratricopeptide (TPR) repeat protein